MVRKKGLTEVVDLVKAYARQELLDPLARVPRWLGMGLAGSLLIVLGSVSLLLAVLRALQTETGTTFSGNLSWIPYLVAAAVLVLGLYVLIRRINKKSLNKESLNKESLNKKSLNKESLNKRSPG